MDSSAKSFFEMALFIFSFNGSPAVVVEVLAYIYYC